MTSDDTIHFERAEKLAKDPENRFATTTRMVEALRRGLDTGEVMEDEIARRRESIPPPSVSRVMQKMGISAPSDAPILSKDTLKGHLEPIAPAPVPDHHQQVTGKQTMKGHMEGPLPVVQEPPSPRVTDASGPASEPERSERRRTVRRR